MDITIRLFDETGVVYDLIVKNENTFVPGTEVGGSPNQCYIPVFEDKHGDQDLWFLGNIFMKDFYTAFDMTPSDTYGKDYNHIGIGH